MPLDITTAITLPGLPSNIPLWDEGVEDHLTRTSSYAVRKMRCLWPNRYYIAQLLRGQTTSGFLYTPPMAYPDAPWMYVDGVDMKGMAGSDPTTGNPTGLVLGPNGMVGYKYALLTVTYRTADWLVDQQLGSLQVDLAAQTITLPGTNSGDAAVAFATTRNDSTEDASVPVTTIEFSRTINQVPNLPIVTAMTAAKSPVNSVPFNLPTQSGSLTAGTTADPGYVMYAGFSSHRTIDTYGTEKWSLTHRFKWRSIPWGYAANPRLVAGSGSGSGGSDSGSGTIIGPFEQLVFKSTWDPIVTRSDLNKLLDPTAP